MTLITSLDTARSGGLHSTSSIASFTRPADILAYLAGDVVSDSAGTAKAIEFKGCGTSGQILMAQLSYEEADTINFELLLFDTQPTNFVDNGPLALVTADIPKLIGRYNFSDTGKALMAAGIAHYTPDLDSEGSSPKPYTSDGSSLYGLLVTRSGFTPASAVKVHLRLQVEIDNR